MLSVNSEAASNVALQGAPHRSPWSNQPPPNDLFGALVNQNKVADTPPAPQPAPLPRHSDQTPAPAEAGSSGSSASNPPPANDPNNNNNNADAGPPPANANADNANASAGGSPGNDANQPSASQSTDGKDTTAKSTDSTKSGDTNGVDPVATQQLLPTTPIPLAVAVPANPVPTNVPAATPSSGGTTPPLAIAAAAIAATSQALSGQGGTPAQGKTDSPSIPATPNNTSTTNLSGSPTAKTTASATASPTVVPPVTAPVTSPNAASANAATQASAAAAAVSVTPKTTSDKASASTPVTDETDSSATSGPLLQNGQPQQGAAAARPETANLAVQAATSDAPSTPSVSAHEHSPAANAVAGAPDPGAPALGTLPPQQGSGATTAPGAALNVIPATNGPVPLNGLALEIAASVKSGKSRFDISLDPAELGRIDVRIDIDRNGQVTSHLTVEKPETLSMLRQDAPQLQRALDDAGLKTGNGGLQFSLRDQSSSGQNGGNDPGANSQRLVIADEDTVPAAVAGRTYGRTLGPSGGVDIRV